MFAVIYQGYIKEGREEDYQHAWHQIAAYFVQHRGSLGSTLHQANDGLWVAYSRWPDKATRDASWSDKDTSDLPDNIKQAIAILKDCIASQLPEICMEVVDDLSHHTHKLSDNHDSVLCKSCS